MLISNVFSILLLFPQNISHAADGPDQLLRMISIDFFAQIADIDIYDIGAALLIKVPDMVLDLLPAENNSLVVE